MARVAHLVLLRGHNGAVVFHDDADCTSFLAALQVAFERARVALHAYALLPDRVWLLCTPLEGDELSRAMQSLGRRFAAQFNRRHQRSGSLWDGRYRSTVVEPGRVLLDAMVFIDQFAAGTTSGEDAQRTTAEWSSARQHLGFDGPIPLNDLAEYWALGNTPFDRASAYRALLSEATPPGDAERIVTATQKGWPLGSPRFIESLQQRTLRRLIPRKRGRPRAL